MGSRSVPQVVKYLHTSRLYKGCRAVLLTRNLISPNVYNYEGLIGNQHRCLSGDGFNLSDILKANAKHKPNKSVGTASSKQLNKSNTAKAKKKDPETGKTTETPGRVKKKDPEINKTVKTFGKESSSDDSKEKSDSVRKTGVPVCLQALLEIPFIPNGEVEIDRSAEFKEFLEDLGLNYLPYVTTIIKATQPPDQIKVLERWQAKMVKELGGEDQFNQYKKGLLDNGQNLHDCIYNRLSGNPDLTPLRQGNEGHWESIAKVLPDVSEVLVMEKECTHPELFYRGKFDCIAKYRGTLCLIEWKTSLKAKPLLSNTYDNPLQVAAYLGAVNWSGMLKKEGIDQLTSAAIVIAYTDGEPATVHSMNQKLCERYWKLWVKRLYTYWLTQYDKKMISENFG